MDVLNNPYLTAANQAIQRGEPEKARTILQAILAQEPGNTEAWFLLSAALDEPSAIASCLRNVLALEPGHQEALKLREQLAQRPDFKPIVVMQVEQSSAALGQSCPYCSSAIEVNNEVVACPKCEVSHHYNCWQENGHICAAKLCDGFSLFEEYEDPLPIQPPPAESKVVVINKENIPDTIMTGRKEQEQRFQRRLLMLALMKEHGVVPEGQTPDLPSVDELLDQIQRDRASGTPPSAGQLPQEQPTDRVETPNLDMTPLMQDAPQSYQAAGVVTDVLPIWSQSAQEGTSLESTTSIETAATPDDTVGLACVQCGYQLQNDKVLFCPQCGAEQKGEESLDK